MASEPNALALIRDVDIVFHSGSVIVISNASFSGIVRDFSFFLIIALIYTVSPGR